MCFKNKGGGRVEKGGKGRGGWRERKGRGGRRGEGRESKGGKGEVSLRLNRTASSLTPALLPDNSYSPPIVN